MPIGRDRLVRLGRFALLAAALGAGVVIAHKWPKDQTVHYVLGATAPDVVEVDARWAPWNPSAGLRGDHEWQREASYHYAAGSAPRVITHEPRLSDGDYAVEIEVVGVQARRRVERRITLSGGVTQIDLADGAHSRLDDADPVARSPGSPAPSPPAQSPPVGRP